MTDSARPPRLLVVCHANVTRSVVAAGLLEISVGREGAGLEVRSAGTHASVGQPVSARTRDALAAVMASPPDLAAHRSAPVDAADVDWADLVVAMEASQVQWLRSRHPEAAARTSTLGHLCRSLSPAPPTLAARVAALRLETHVPSAADDVADPAGGDHDAYVATMRELVAQCDALGALLVG